MEKESQQIEELKTELRIYKQVINIKSLEIAIKYIPEVNLEDIEARTDFCSLRNWIRDDANEY